MQDAGECQEGKSITEAEIEGFYKERYDAQRRLGRKSAQFIEVNEILGAMRKEIKDIIGDKKSLFR